MAKKKEPKRHHQGRPSFQTSKVWLFLEHWSSSKKLDNINGDASAANEDTSASCSSSLLHCPLPTLVTFFALKYADCVDQANNEGKSLRTVFVRQEKNGEADPEKMDNRPEIYLQVETSSSVLIADQNGSSLVSDDKELGQVSRDLLCELPAIYLPEINLWITGLCSVIRYVCLNIGGDKAYHLLGHTASTLSAPAEVSVWTRFCEIDMPSATETLLSRRSMMTFLLPEELAKFEAHMKQPIRMHNIRKRMQTENFVPSGSSGEDPIQEFARSQHVYAEGPDCLLSDVILFTYYFLIDQKISIANCLSSSQLLPLTSKWFDHIAKTTKMRELASHIIRADVKTDGNGEAEETATSFKLPTVKNQSLYVSDPSRINPASRVFTRAGVVESAMKWFDSSGIERLMSSQFSLHQSAQQLLSQMGNNASPPTVTADLTAEMRKKLDWNQMPDLVHPLHGGKLPIDRAGKKCEQLESLALAVLSLVECRESKNLTIVDFCSGGGHLAILLAYLLPESTMILVENKAESLERAIERTRALGLNNCVFFQGNLDYFRGDFDIGMSLHACGVATDLVLKMCMEKQADIVSCPCCYGKVQENHVLSYPRSKLFANPQNACTFQNYVVIGHTADQTHFTRTDGSGKVDGEEEVGHALLEQGTKAMDIIDTDRIQLALERGYKQVVLTKLNPPTCTPKNNLIIGKFA